MNDQKEQQMWNMQLQIRLQELSRRAAHNLGRHLKMEQETATFPDPSDKRAVRFLLESQQELGAFVTHIRGFLDSSGRVVRLQEGDGARVRELIRFCAQYGHTRSRRLSSEYQGYKAGGSRSQRGAEQKLARNEKLKSKHEGIKTNKPRAAQSGWLTKKYFRYIMQN